MTAPLLSVVGLSVVAGEHAIVSDVSLALGAGEALGIAGESGCGKSTVALSIMRMLAPGLRIGAGSITLRPPGADEIRIDRRTERGMELVRGSQIGLVMQGALNALDPIQRIDRQFAEVVVAHDPGASASQVVRWRDELMDMVGLPIERARSYPHELSGGQRQRFMLVMALAARPQLLIADEPTTAVDTMLQAQILELLGRLRAELGLAMLMISHDLGVLAQACERLAVMYAGRLVETGPTELVLGDPQHPYTRMLLRARPSVHGPRSLPAAIPGAPPRPESPLSGCSFAPRCPHAVERCSVAPALIERQPGRVAACHRVGELGAVAPAARGEAAVAVAASAGGRVRDDPLLAELRDVHVHYAARRRRGSSAVRALDGVSLSLRRGEILGVVGESGSGKSTLARTLLGLVQPTTGTLEIDGRPRSSRADLRDMRRIVQMVFQDPYDTLDPHDTVRTIVREPLVVHGVAPAEHDARMRTALERAGLEPDGALLDRRPRELSGGQRQRVAIAAALALGPAGLICDEPVSMLDVSIQAQILETLAELRSGQDIGVLLITHDLGLAWALCDRVAVMYLGQIVEQGATEQVLRDPSHPYTQALLAAVPEVGD